MNARITTALRIGVVLTSVACACVAVVLALRDEEPAESRSGAVVEFARPEEWLGELKSGRELLFDKPDSPKNSSNQRRKLCVKGLGPLPAEAVPHIKRRIESELRFHQAELERASEKEPTGDMEFHRYAKETLLKTLTYERYVAIRELFTQGDYITVVSGTRLMLPRKTYLPVIMSDAVRMGGQTADIVFAIPLDRFPAVAQAHADYLTADDDLTGAHIRAFNALSPEERNARIAAHDIAWKELASLGKNKQLSIAEKAKLRRRYTKDLLPRGTVARMGVLYRRQRKPRK
jgi:hypothetical protein